MTQRAIDLLNQWITDTVRPVPPADRAREAARLTVEFRAYAADAGLNLDRLEEDLGEDLISYMNDALLDAADPAADGATEDEE